MTRSTAFILVGLTIICTVAGQLAIKWQAGKVAAVPATVEGKLAVLAHLLINPWIIAGLAAALFAALCWIIAMTKLPLSTAYPFMALTFPSVVVASHWLFNEELTLPKLIGLAFVIAGVSIIGAAQ